MKKKIILLCLAGVLAGTAIIGGTFASFQTETRQQGVTEITTKELSIGIAEKNNEESQISLASAATPGKMIPVNRSIVNDTEEGYDLYTRVTIYKRWNQEGLDSSKISAYLGDYELSLDGESAEANREAIRQQSGWILWYADDEQMVLYYTQPLAASQESSTVLSGLQIDESVNNDYADAELTVEFEVDAVQSIAVEDAMVSEWGVYPVIDENGVITAITE